MKRLLRLWMLLVPMALGIASCSDNDDNPVTPPEPDKPASELADYAILFYGHGGGNLDAAILANIDQFYSADDDSYNKVKIAVQYKFSSKERLMANSDEDDRDEDLFTTVDRQTVRFIVDPTEDMDADEYEAYIYGEKNADVANPDSLTNFINWAAKACPAKNYILLLSDHGGGYMPHDDLPYTQSTARTRAVIFDDGNGGKSFSVKSLAAAISATDIRPQVIYMDACLMNSVEYQFELKDLADYLVLSTFVVPGFGGNYISLVNELAQNSDIETALANFCKNSVDNWDALYKKEYGDDYRLYADMTVTRTSALNAFGEKWKEFTDRLIDGYQNGGAEVKAAIDEVTKNYTFKVDNERPGYDLSNYVAAMCLKVPTYFPETFSNDLASAFNNGIVYQQSSDYLAKNDYEVDCSILLGAKGHYRVYAWGETESEDWALKYFIEYQPDGERAVYYSDNTLYGYMAPWASTFADTYEQLTFDRLTGWSRWIKLNEQEPAPFSPATMTLSLFDIPE